MLATCMLDLVTVIAGILRWCKASAKQSVKMTHPAGMRQHVRAVIDLKCASAVTMCTLFAAMQ